MKRTTCLLSIVVLSMWLVLAVAPAQGMDQTGKLGLGLHGLVYKLGLTDHSDFWTVGEGVNLGLKYGLTSKAAIGLEGQIMQTYLADLSDGSKLEDGAGFTFDNVTDGPRQRAYVIGAVVEYHFMPEKNWSPYIFGGPGIYIWRWTDKDWNTLISADPSLIGTGIPPLDTDSECYYMKDQELYLMGGAGLEFFPAEWLSFDFGAKFRYLSHLLTNFKDGRDIVGSDPGQLDLPKGIGELYAGLTLYFGGKKECPPLSCQGSGNPMSGSPSLTVQFDGSASGGCPPGTYSWDFGDGVSSSDQSPRHTYQTAGNYTAWLTVTDSKGNRCQESVSSIMVGCPPLTCTASANPTNGPVPLTVQFGATVSGGCPPYTYNWNIGEERSSSEQNPSQRIEKAGNYTARLTVTDSKGNRCQESVSYETFVEYIPTPDKPIVLHGVKFEFDKSILSVRADSLLDLVAASMKRRPDVKVEVAGHCDWVGSDAYNQALSIRRAEAVRDYLIYKGVKAENLTFKGYGETKPMADNKTAEGRALNRRVELRRVQ
ncbi:MAG: PKD domain-containing protein [Candidatus Eisenbacteria bacterium]|nr:PKD domain-containing protein [Candidatus Eisenbacteria bacterium]